MRLNKDRMLQTLLVSCASLAFAGDVGLPEEWTYATGELIVSSAGMAADGAVFFGSSDYKLHALNPDGSLRWTFLTGDWIDSTPAVGKDGTVYFGGWDNFIYALNPDGSLRWSYETGSAVIGSPVLVDGRVIVGSLDGFCYALDAANGNFVWAYLADTELHASPLHADGRIYLAGYDATLHCVDAANGEQLWFADTADLRPMLTPTTQHRILAAPVRTADGSILFASGSGLLFAFDPIGDLLWTFEANAEIDSAPVIDSAGEIYFGCRDGLLYNLTSDGFLDWAASVGRVYYSSPAIGRGNIIYLLASIGGGKSQLYQIDEYGFALDTIVIDSLNDASPLLTPNGYLYIGMFNGALYKFDPISPPAESAWPLFQQNPARRASEGRYWQPYREWLADWFNEDAASDPALVEGTDGDQFSLLAEFALGLNPTVTDQASVTFTLNEETAEASVWKYAKALDVLVRLEAATDLANFSEVGIPETVDINGGFNRLSASAEKTNDQLFLRFLFEEF